MSSVIEGIEAGQAALDEIAVLRRLPSALQDADEKTKSQANRKNGGEVGTTAPVLRSRRPRSTGTQRGRSAYRFISRTVSRARSPLCW